MQSQIQRSVKADTPGKMFLQACSLLAHQSTSRRRCLQSGNTQLAERHSQVAAFWLPVSCRCVWQMAERDSGSTTRRGSTKSRQQTLGSLIVLVSKGSGRQIVLIAHGCKLIQKGNTHTYTQAHRHTICAGSFRLSHKTLGGTYSTHFVLSLDTQAGRLYGKLHLSGSG